MLLNVISVWAAVVPQNDDVPQDGNVSQNDDVPQDGNVSQNDDVPQDGSFSAGRQLCRSRRRRAANGGGNALFFPKIYYTITAFRAKNDDE